MAEISCYKVPVSQGERLYAPLLYSLFELAENLNKSFPMLCCDLIGYFRNFFKLLFANNSTLTFQTPFLEALPTGS